MHRMFLAAALLLTVTLRADVTGSLVTPEGKPVAGARVELFAAIPFAHELAQFTSKDPQPREPLTVTESDAKGHFKLVAAERGNYVVRVSRAGFAPGGIDTEGAEDLGGLLMRPAAMQRGRVTANGKPVANARLWFASGAPWATTTDENGVYSVPDPAVWKPAVHVHHPDHARYVESMKLHGSVDLTIELSQGTTLRGRVLDPSGKSGAKASLAVDGIAMGESAEDGTFALQHVPGTWREVVATTGNLVARSGRGNLEAMRLARGITVSGRVFDAKSGLPLHGTTVSLVLPNYADVAGAVAVSDEKGAWTIEGLLPGQYQLQASHAGYGFERAKITVDRDTRSKDIQLQRVGRFVGRVLGNDDEPVAAALVQASSRLQDRMFLQQNAQVSAIDGRYVVRVQPDFLDRELNVEARARGYAITKVGPHTLKPGDEKRVEVHLSQGFALRGRVVDTEGNPLRGITVAAVENTGESFPRPFFVQWEDEPQTDADGRVTLHLRPATYDVYVTGPGFASKQLSGIKVEGTTEPFAATLEPAVSISGRVVTADGEGVPDLRLEAIVDGPFIVATSGSSGSFALHGLPRKTVPVMINGERGIAEFRHIEAPAENVTIELLPTVDVSGRVVTTDGAAVPDFTIGIGRPQEGAGFYANTERDQTFHDPEGKFRLEDVVVRPSEVVVTAPGYRRARVRVELAKGKDVEDVEVKLEAGGRVTGRITAADGSPLEGAHVAFDINGKTNHGESVESDASGEYMIEAAPLGETALLFRKRGFVPLKKNVTIGRDGTHVDAQLSEGLTLRGRVVTDTGAPVDGADVSAVTNAANSMSYPVSTDANGRFAISGLGNAIYRVLAAKQGFVEARLEEVDVERAGELTLTLRSGATIVGRVTGVAFGPEARVRVGVGAADYQSRWGEVQSDGTYRVEGVPAAEIGIVARVEGRQYRRSDMIEMRAENGQTYTVDIEFKEHNTIRGRVMREGAPLTNARISFAPRHRADLTTAAATVSADGTYEITGLQSGDYNVSVVAPNMGASYTVVRSLTRSQTLDIDVRPASLVVHVLDDTTGDPISDAELSMQPTDSATRTRSPAKSDAAGRVVIESISPGDYNVRIAKSGYAGQLSQRSFSEGSRVGFEARLVPSEGLRLTILDSRTGKPVAAFVTARNTAGTVVLSDRPSPRPDGSLLVPLAPGRYQLHLMSTGLGNTYTDVTSPGTQQVTMHPGGAIEFALTGTKRVLLLSADGRPYHMDPGDLTAVETVMGGTLYTDVAPGRYTLQVLGPNDEIESTRQVEVVAGRTVKVSL